MNKHKTHRFREQIGGYQKGKGLGVDKKSERGQLYGNGWWLVLLWWSLCSTYKYQIIVLCTWNYYNVICQFYSIFKKGVRSYYWMFNSQELFNYRTFSHVIPSISDIYTIKWTKKNPCIFYFPFQIRSFTITKPSSRSPILNIIPIFQWNTQNLGPNYNKK